MSFKVKDLPSDAIPTNQIDGIFEYVASLDFEEPWLQGYLAGHLALLLFILKTRKETLVQGTLFLGLLLTVYFAEWINEFLAQNYKSFTKHQYFDSQGMFISLMLSLPALIHCLVMLINWMLMSGQMLVRVKQKQLLEEQEKRSVDKSK